VNTGSPLYDLSDYLTVRAQVDENDIGKVALDQKAEVNVDSYPDEVFQAHVELINPSAVVINQVVSYYVLLKFEAPPRDLKTGMTANINFILSEKKGVLTLPSYAVKGEENAAVQLQVLPPTSAKAQARQVRLGDSDGNRVEVLSGLSEHEKVVVAALKLQEAPGGGPFGASSATGKVHTATGGPKK
jgi:macrolide-specific efflux system membrane fusion protein